MLILKNTIFVAPFTGKLSPCVVVKYCIYKTLIDENYILIYRSLKKINKYIFLSINIPLTNLLLIFLTPYSVEVVDKYPYALRIQLDQRNQQQKIEVCCPGYAPMRWRGSTICKPVCDNCRNGRCVAPNECECFDSFVANDNGDCVFSCPLGCLNGRCFLDGTCQCDPGFKLDETRKFCRPICSNGCGINPRHNCTEPEVCGCAKGYQLTDDGCIPVCDPDCGEGGECREPNECYCTPGYELKDGVCQRECYQ